ncbi:hypothetical protein NS354_07145 [Leucobacter chromiiresistens]|uniref:Uncharacterized protein n=1 Tax=Leucobacter chromiiresistens TaxID=1079994 RepID=A0A147ENB6_9MICO|nr:hypothetical protein NS354_07145 [Leucobacter chromiiresistens]
MSASPDSAGARVSSAAGAAIASAAEPRSAAAITSAAATLRAQVAIRQRRWAWLSGMGYSKGRAGSWPASAAAGAERGRIARLPPRGTPGVWG